HEEAIAVSEAPIGEPPAEAVMPAVAAPQIDDRPPEPAIKPIVIGVDEPEAPPKRRGWWRH
ncbi:MAG TPA: hypothetical protein VMA86_07365, partial [Acetobacteraceae bacterium]|nr:hypothetical protein [Acetobacteraceae bacterium]